MNYSIPVQWYRISVLKCAQTVDTYDVPIYFTESPFFILVNACPWCHDCTPARTVSPQDDLMPFSMVLTVYADLCPSTERERDYTSALIKMLSVNRWRVLRIRCPCPCRPMVLDAWRHFLSNRPCRNRFRIGSDNLSLWRVGRTNKIACLSRSTQ